MLLLLSLLTSCDLCHITYGVNTADGVGVGRVYVAVEDEGCVKDSEREVVLLSFNMNLRSVCLACLLCWLMSMRMEMRLV